MPSIMMVSKYYPPLSYGGTEKYVEVVSHKLAERGLPVTILGPSTGKEISYEQSGRVLICRFPIRTLGFLEFSKRITLITCDARSMPFSDEYFDLILFSFNGIDYMSHEDRSEALKEIKRVGKKGGYLCFSTHNLYTMDRLFTLKLSRNPFRLCDYVRGYVLLRLLNKDIQEMKKQSFVTVKDDGDRDFKNLVHYIKPRYQIEQLNNLGFKNVEVLSLEGKKIKNEVQLKTVEDPWLYYSCRI